MGNHANLIKMIVITIVFLIGASLSAYYVFVMKKV